MNRLDPNYCRCPRCGGHNVMVLDGEPEATVYRFHAGQFIGFPANAQPQLVGPLFLVCEKSGCSHQWTPHLTPIERTATETRINHALGLIDAAEDPLQVRFATAYATGYIDSMYDAELVPESAVEGYRDDARARRAKRLSELGAGD